MDESEWVNINMGRISKDEASNIAREVRGMVDPLSNVYPQGDKKKRGQIKITLDNYGQYHFYLNQRALVYLLTFMKNIKSPIKKQDDMAICPPETPDYLRWDKPSDSTPG